MPGHRITPQRICNVRFWPQSFPKRTNATTFLCHLCAMPSPRLVLDCPTPKVARARRGGGWPRGSAIRRCHCPTWGRTTPLCWGLPCRNGDRRPNRGQEQAVAPATSPTPAMASPAAAAPAATPGLGLPRPGVGGPTSPESGKRLPRGRVVMVASVAMDWAEALEIVGTTGARAVARSRRAIVGWRSTSTPRMPRKAAEPAATGSPIELTGYEPRGNGSTREEQGNSRLWQHLRTTREAAVEAALGAVAACRVATCLPRIWVAVRVMAAVTAAAEEKIGAGRGLEREGGRPRGRKGQRRKRMVAATFRRGS